MKIQTAEVHPVVKEFYNNTEILAYIIFINNIPFLTLVLYNTHYSTADTVANLECSTLEKILIVIINRYNIRDFQTVMKNTDEQFQSLIEQDRVGVKFNVVSIGDHTPVFE